MNRPPIKLIEDRVADIAIKSKRAPDWLDRAAAVVGDVCMLRKAFQRMHRRCQRAEALAQREGRRADRMATLLRRIDGGLKC